MSHFVLPFVPNAGTKEIVSNTFMMFVFSQCCDQRVELYTSDLCCVLQICGSCCNAAVTGAQMCVCVCVCVCVCGVACVRVVCVVCVVCVCVCGGVCVCGVCVCSVRVVCVRVCVCVRVWCVCGSWCGSMNVWRRWSPCFFTWEGNVNKFLLTVFSF